MRMKSMVRLLAGVASAALMSDVADAQELGDEKSRTPVPVEEVVVTGIVYRDRTESIAPVLQYDLDYFQRFEPLTVGDMLKRTPSVAFVSDIGEFDGVRLRGLNPGYTQILINGEKVPGEGGDRSFFVDRIPAELVERVEIVRSASANRSGDAMAGALNIVLKDSYVFDGAFVRAGGLHFDDGKYKPVLGGIISGDVGAGRGLFGFNIQGRHNPKTKVSYRLEPDSGVLEFDNREDQSDVRDGTDYSFNASLSYPIGDGELDLSGFYVHTDRTEKEFSEEYEDDTSTDPADLTTVTPQNEDINQDNYSLLGKFRQPMFGGKTQLKVGFSQFTHDKVATEEETEYDPFPAIDDFGGEREFTDTTDKEWNFELKHKRELGELELEFGIEHQIKQRDNTIAVAEISNPGDAYPAASVDSDFSVREKRLDPFVMLTGGAGSTFEWETGLRYETTKFEVKGAPLSNDYRFLLPSAHLKINLGEEDRLSFSVARTVHRPSFDDLMPGLLEEEPTEDNDLLGNPGLNPESAWGIDVGYEHRFGNKGVAGVNVFYRDVKDYIELTSTGVVSSSGDGFVFQPQNVGDAKVWGIEFDLSTPLTFLGMENTGVFVNYSWLDSDVYDPIINAKRRFNDQAKFVLNAGFIHDIPSWGVGLGASYRKQGDAFSRVQGETVATVYGGDLEAFVEKRFGDRFILRLTGSNLLDASKEETFFKWDTLEDQQSGDIDDLDEFELERERSGPVFQLVGRLAL